jgi:hypothetical protein
LREEGTFNEGEDTYVFPEKRKAEKRV